MKLFIVIGIGFLLAGGGATACGVDEPDESRGEQQQIRDAGVYSQALTESRTTPVLPFEGNAVRWSCSDSECSSSTVAVEVYQESAPVNESEVPVEPSARSTESAGPSHAQWRADVATKSNEMVHVVIELSDSSNAIFDRNWAAAESKFDRSVLINNRVAELKGLQPGVKNDVKSLGGSINGTFWSSNSFSAEIPVEAVAVLEARPDVIGV